MTARLAPVVFVLLWSTGFIGARLGLPHATPFAFLTVRLAIAGALLALLALVTRSPGPSGRRQSGDAAIVGVLLHAGYLGGVFFAISRGMPAGVSAVIVSLQPVLVSVLAVRVLDEHLVRRQWVGLAAGLGGVALVVAPGTGGALPAAGLAACLVALVSGTAGTLHQKRHGAGIPLLSGTAVQYAAATAVLLALTLTVEDPSIRWTGEFVVALVHLILVLSLGAVLLLLVLLRRGTAASVSSLFYLVPPATALEAFVLFDERLSPLSLVGVLVSAVGVALVLRPPAAATAQVAASSPT